MHPQSYDRRFSLAMLSLLLMICLVCVTDTPKMLAFFAGTLVIVGFWVLFNSPSLPKPWLIGIGAILAIILGAVFLIWYFRVGRNILTPFFDPQKYFDTVSKSLLTPTP